MQMMANWSIHETDWKNYIKLNLTRARNTGSSSPEVLFPFLKGLRAEISLIHLAKKRGISVLFFTHFKAEYCQLLCHAGADPGACCLSLWGYMSWQCRRGSENELRKGGIIWSDGKYYLPLLKHRAAYRFLKMPGIFFCYQCAMV